MDTEHQTLSLFLCGDVMTGRGIDQALPHPTGPVLFEDYVGDAREYVALAEKANGPIQKPVSFKYIWGDALQELSAFNPDLRIINLETSITSDGEPWLGKGIHYRMHPENAACLQAAHINACALANNHVLDWDYPALLETLDTLEKMGIAHPGAGRNAQEASAPAILQLPNRPRVLLFSYGSMTSGVLPTWRATEGQPGVNLLEAHLENGVTGILDHIRHFQKPGDITIFSIHWGSNWGYEVTPAQVAFARQLIDNGVSIVHGHSSHHVRPMEIYHDGLILYGAGDFINDYEGITGYEEFRSDLSLMYLIRLEDRRISSLRLVPMQLRQFQLHRACPEDSTWFCTLLNRICAENKTQFQLLKDNCITIKL